MFALVLSCQMRVANVLGVGMMFFVALLNFFFGATMTTVRGVSFLYIYN